MTIRKLTTQEALNYNDNNYLVQFIENESLSYYVYDNEEDEEKLLSQNVLMHSPTEKIVSIRESELKERPTEKTNTLSLQQDASKKLTIKNINREDLSYEVRKYFKWRKGDMVERLFKQGTSKYDGFIKYLYNKGY